VDVALYPVTLVEAIAIFVVGIDSLVVVDA
jgi:hypothetical protein